MQKLVKKLEKICIIAMIIICLIQIPHSANSAFTNEITESFGGKANTTALVLYFQLAIPLTFGGKTQVNFANSLPTVTGEHPANETTGLNLSIAVGCTVNDANENHTMNVTYASNYTGAWVNYQTNSSITDGQGTNWTFTSANEYDTKYYWRVYVDDGMDNVSSDLFWFQTQVNPEPGFGLYFTESFGGKTDVSSTIEPDVHPDSWDGGTPNVGTSIQYNFTYYQNGTATVDVKIGFNVTNYTYVNYADWLSNGHDNYTANFTVDDWSSETNIEPKSGELAVTILKEDVAPDSSFNFGIRIWIPRTVSYANLREDYKIMFTTTAS